MIRYVDHRHLTIGYWLHERVLLDDEVAAAYARGDYPNTELCIPNWDAELEIYKLTGMAGCPLPPKGSKARELLRARIRNAVLRFRSN
jgi:hypothetical protein